MKPWQNTAAQRRKTLDERFDEKYSVNTETGCWEWQAHKFRGYGRFNYPGGQLAHRYAYERAHGDISPDLTVDHLCRNRGCVNPAHLELVTAAENTRRGERATRTHCPNGHPYDRVRYLPNGWRNRTCSICSRAYFAARYKRLKAAGSAR